MSELETIEVELTEGGEQTFGPEKLEAARGKLVTTVRGKRRIPIRALLEKARELREEAATMSPADARLYHNLLVDLWLEAKHVVAKSKHTYIPGRELVEDKDTGRKKWQPVMIADHRLTLMAISQARAVVQDMIRHREKMDEQETGIPRWAIEVIERGLRNYPEAKAALLQDLAVGPHEKEAER